MDYYDGLKAGIAGLVGAVISGLGVALGLKPRIDQATRDIKSIKKEELPRIEKDIADVKENVVWKGECGNCKTDLVHRIDQVGTDVREIGKDIKYLLQRKR